MLIGIVEANPNIRYLLQIVLEYEHHQVEILAQHTQRGAHDVLLIDPGAPPSGLPLLGELEGTASIVLTTHDEYCWPCKKRHLPLLQKPFHPKDLVTLVDAVGTSMSRSVSSGVPACPRSDGGMSSAS